MPAVYVETNFEATVNLTSDDDFVYGEWTDKKLAKERVEYKKPNKGVWFQIANPEDAVEVFPIPITENDVYEGGIEIAQDGRKFTFKVNLKAKVNVHKTTKEKIDLGITPKLTGLSINGQEYPVEMSADIKVQSKKI
jgi:hypothetical protein